MIAHVWDIDLPRGIGLQRPPDFLLHPFFGMLEAVQEGLASSNHPCIRAVLIDLQLQKGLTPQCIPEEMENEGVRSTAEVADEDRMEIRIFLGKVGRAQDLLSVAPIHLLYPLFAPNRIQG